MTGTRRRTRRRFAPGTPICPITSITSAIWWSGGAGSRATISRSPTWLRRRISRASIISATCRGKRMPRPRNGMQGSSRGRAFARSSPITFPARRRPSTTPTSIFSPTSGTPCVLRDAPLRGAPQDEEHLFAASKAYLILRRREAPSRRTHIPLCSFRTVLRRRTVRFDGRRPIDPRAEPQFEHQEGPQPCVVIGPIGAVLVEQPLDVFGPHQAALASCRRQQGVVGEILQLAPQPLVDRAAEPHFLAAQDLIGQIGRHRRLKERLCFPPRHLDFGRDPRGPFQ